MRNRKNGKVDSEYVVSLPMREKNFRKINFQTIRPIVCENEYNLMSFQNILTICEKLMNFQIIWLKMTELFIQFENDRFLDDNK